MASLDEIHALLTRILEELPGLINRSQINPRQVVTSTGLSDITERLGLVRAGEFRSGNEKEPGFGFSGVRIGYPAFSYNDEEWNVAGVDDDVLQVGINAATGKLIAGGGDIVIDSIGIMVKNQRATFGFEDTSGVRSNLYIYSDGADDLVLKNKTGGNAVRMDVDSTAHGVMRLTFVESGTDVPTLSIEDVTTGGIDHAKFIMGDSGGNVIFAGLDGVTSVLNDGGYDIDFRIESANNPYAFQLDAGLDEIISLAWTGWETVAETWTYASATSFTISGGNYTNKYRKGARLRWVQTSTYLGIVASSSYNAGTNTTTVNLIPNNDNSIANATISSPQLSYLENPKSFSTWFTWTPTFTNLTVGDGTLTFKWRAVGNTIQMYVLFIYGTTSSISGNVSISLPVSPESFYGNNDPLGLAHLVDVSASTIYSGDCMLVSGKIEPRVHSTGGTYGSVVNVNGTVPMTWTTNDEMRLTFSYIF